MRLLKIYSCFILMAITNIALGQSKSFIDSLKTVLPSTNEKKERIDVLNELAHYLHINETDTANIYADEALALSKEIEYSFGKAYGLSSKARISTLQGDTDSALKLAYEALLIAEKIGTPQAITKPVSSLGFIYFNLSNLDSMIKYDARAVDLAKEMKDEQAILVAQNNLAVDYNEKGYYTESLRNYFETLEILKKRPEDSLRHFMIYSNIATNHLAIGDYQDALKYSQKSYDIIQQLDEPDRQITAALYLAECYFMLADYDRALELLHGLVPKTEKEDFGFKEFTCATFKLLGQITSITEGPEKAIPYLEKSVHYADSAIGPDIKAIARHQLARGLVEAGQFQKSDTLLASALELAQEAGNLTVIRDTFLYMAKSDSLRNDLNGYITNYLTFNQYEDSLLSIEKEKSIAQLKIAYETELKDDKIKVLNSENAISKERQAKLQQAQIALIAGLVLLVCLAAVLYSRYRSKQKSLKIINQKNNENQLLIKEIHHRVKNNLQIILSLLGAQNNLLKEDSQALRVIMESQNRIKSLSLIHEDLYQNKNFTEVSSKQYFNDLLQHLMNSFSGSSTIVHLRTDIEDAQLRMSLAVPLGLILNELITNCYKYAFQNSHTGVIQVSFSKTSEDFYNLRIQDNGSGLPKDFTFHNSASFGMQLVNGLTSQLNGSIDIVNSDGTVVDVTVPDTEQVA